MTAKKKQNDTPENLVADIQPYTGPEITSGAPETTAWSPAIAANGMKLLAAALAKAQNECQNVTFNKVNPHFRSRYADLSAVRDAVIPVFSKYGLSIIQAPNVVPEIGFALETRIIHEGGETMSFYWPLPTNIDKPQVIASAVTYARRVSMASVAAIAGEEDDDGNAAQNPNGGGSRTGPVGSGAGGANRGAENTPGGIVL